MLEVELNTNNSPATSILEKYVRTSHTGVTGEPDTPETPSRNDQTPVRRDRRSRSELRWRLGGQQEKHGRQGSLSRLVGKHERDKRDKIERENQILLRKILDCHHGVDRDRTSAIPSPAHPQRQRPELSKTPKHLRTSNQINSKRVKQKTDYENLLLLQKIQNVKPSSSVRKAFC